MKIETALGSAMSRAGMNTDESRLRLIAIDVLAKHHGNVIRALRTFEKEIDGEPELIREALRFYLNNFRLPEVGQAVPDNHVPRANDRQTNGGDDGHITIATRPNSAASSPTSRGRTGQVEAATLSDAARPVREPSAQQRAASAVVAKKISILDTFKIGNRAIGDWSIVAAKSEGPHMAFHGHVLTEAAAEAARITANVESWMTIRDVLNASQVQQIIQRAAGITDAA